jgi:Protein of unknown function (DUF4231)
MIRARTGPLFLLAESRKVGRRMPSGSGLPKSPPGEAVCKRLFCIAERSLELQSGNWGTGHGMADQARERDPRAKAREDRAEQYFDQDLKGQRRWYSERASSYKQRAQVLGLLVIGAGAATSFVQVFAVLPWVPVVTAALGAVVVLIEGWQRIARYGETWTAYRTASERMKREQRLYVNGAGTYRNVEEDEAYLRFVEGIEGILAEEQQIYWQNRGSGAPAGEQPKSAAPGDADGSHV